MFTHEDVKNEIKKESQKKNKRIKLTFSLMIKVSMHPQTGIPLMYHDQLNIVCHHLEDIKQ